jgi:ribulose bisphosphate carboxylase small subunit
MAEQGWITSEVTQEHLQNLMSQGFMMAVELATCHMPKDPTSLVPVRGYVVACTVFYE